MEKNRRSEILSLIGAIILSTQEVERLLKFVLPFTDSNDPSITSALARHQKLKKRTFGNLLEDFLNSSSSMSHGWQEHLDDLVERRNDIVHHFAETYGPKLSCGDDEHVIVALKTQLANTNRLREALGLAALTLVEGFRDIIFQDTSQYPDMIKLCDDFREIFAPDATLP